MNSAWAGRTLVLLLGMAGVLSCITSAPPLGPGAEPVPCQAVATRCGKLLAEAAEAPYRLHDVTGQTLALDVLTHHLSAEAKLLSGLNVLLVFDTPKSASERLVVLSLVPQLEPLMLRGPLIHVVAIGGETTGLSLTTEDGRRVEIDVAQHQLVQAAQALVGHECVVTGTYKIVHGVEIPRRLVFEATAIAAPEPPPPL